MRGRVSNAGEAGELQVSLSRNDMIARNCGNATGPVFSVEADGALLRDVSQGLTYSKAASAAASEAASAAASTFAATTLPLTGHIRIGQAVQQGAGWSDRRARVLESGTVALRVVPTFSEERVTLSTEQLDEGSLLDTHACLLDPRDESGGPTPACPPPHAAAAQGFVRVDPKGSLKVQLYARGPVGVQAFASATQQQIVVPNMIAAWRSDAIRVWGSFVLLVVGLWKPVMELLRFAAKAAGNPAGIARQLLGLDNPAETKAAFLGGSEDDTLDQQENAEIAKQQALKRRQ